MDTKATVQRKADVTRALMRLSAARREKLEALDFDVFVEGLLEFPGDDVATVCAEFGRIEPGEYQPRFPPLYVLREACIQRGRVRHQRALPAAPLDARFPPLSDEKWAEIRAKFQEVLARRTMPDSKTNTPQETETDDDHMATAR